MSAGPARSCSGSAVEVTRNRTGRHALSAMAARVTRLGCSNKEHKPETTRSQTRRLGARRRQRLRMRSWCFIRTDSAITERTPPGRPIRNMVAARWTISTMKSRMRNVNKIKIARLREYLEFASARLRSFRRPHRLTLRKIAGCSAMTMGNGRYVMDPYRTKTGTYQRDEPCDQHAVNRLEFSASRARRPVRPRALPGWVAT